MPAAVLSLIGVLAVGAALRTPAVDGAKVSAAATGLPLVPKTPTAVVASMPSSPAPLVPPHQLARTSVISAGERPSIGVVVESDDVATASLIRSLATGASVPVQIEQVTTGGWEATLRALRDQPRVAVLRYDALRSALGAPASAGLPPLEIVAPLSAEAICVVVRSDSQLKFIHDIRGKVVDAGRPGSSRALTANLLYRQMFRQTMPQTGRRASASAQEALEQLTAGEPTTHIIAISASTLKDWRVSHPAEARGIRVLGLDPNSAESQRALHTFLSLPADDLPGVVGVGRTTTLGLLTFLVTARQTGARAEPHERDMAALASTLCQSLPALRSSGGAWRAVHPALQIDFGIPYSASARSAFASCDGAADSVAVPIAKMLPTRS